MQSLIVCSLDPESFALDTPRYQVTTHIENPYLRTGMLHMGGSYSIERNYIYIYIYIITLYAITTPHV